METKKNIESSLIQWRLNKIKEISSTINQCDKVIEDFSERLEWDKNQLHAQPNIKKAQCPFNVHHVMNLDDLDNHVLKCRVKQMGFTPCESSSGFYSGRSSVVSIASDVANRNHRDIDVPSELHVYMYTPEERLNQYNAAVQITSSKRKAESDQLESELNESAQDPEGKTSDKLKSEIELLAEQRDYKRRRQSYRAKNVHITKRTPLEITREIIKNRMQELQNMYQETNEATLPPKDI